jgi:hypothetical protein
MTPNELIDDALAALAVRRGTWLGDDLAVGTGLTMVDRAC